MHFRSKRLPTDRWGIYEGSNLLATVGCRWECQKILRALQQRQGSDSCEDLSLDSTLLTGDYPSVATQEAERHDQSMVIR